MGGSGLRDPEQAGSHAVLRVLLSGHTVCTCWESEECPKVSAQTRPAPGYSQNPQLPLSSPEAPGKGEDPRAGQLSTLGTGTVMSGERDTDRKTCLERLSALALAWLVLCSLSDPVLPPAQDVLPRPLLSEL